MSVQLKRGETVSLNALAHARIESRPIETTRDALKRNDLDAMHVAIKVFGLK